ncbi:MAG: 50S ribosomal protein L4 [Candidatus Latescibacteria bacterium]|nr:50S ribosomal protein L4 [Candidatus Latescibacterota bacterium]
MGHQVDVLSSAGQSAGTVELSDAIFSSEVSEYALYRAVVTYEANQRQGNASAKGRSEVNRTGRKHHRQKGTGMARRGSLRSPLVRGGGVAFGPVPRSYYSKLPKSLKRAAFRSALALRAGEERIKVVDDFNLPAPSTKSFASVVDACGVAGQKALFVTPEVDLILVKSCRNLPGVSMCPIDTLGAYDIIAADVVVFTRQALAKLQDGGREKEDSGE